VEPNGATPQYRRLADVVRELIVIGELPLGSRMPSERELADAVSISRTTVIAAYNLLRADSLLMTQGRVGTWVSAGPQ
jgi:DNA-binding GntR family transcriptional regulator